MRAVQLVQLGAEGEMKTRSLRDPYPAHFSPCPPSFRGFSFATPAAGYFATGVGAPYAQDAVIAVDRVTGKQVFRECLLRIVWRGAAPRFISHALSPSLSPSLPPSLLLPPPSC